MKQYRNITTKEVVLEDEAFDYTLEQINKGLSEKDKQMLVDWYFSDNWIEEEI